MPRALHTRLGGSLIAALLCSWCASGICGQGFEKAGLMKKKIILHRKLPAVVHFTGSAIETKVTARDAKYSDIVGTLNDQLQTELLKNNDRFRLDNKSPELIVTCSVTSFDIPPRLNTQRTVVIKQKGQQVPVTTYYYTIAGMLEVSYQADDRAGRVLDAENVTAKYSEEFEAGTNENTHESFLDKTEKPFKRMAGKKTDDSSGPPSSSELRLKLIHDAVHQIVPRVTATNEPVEILLARGKLDEANKSAEGGLWTRYLEQLEQMTPLPKTQDDAYRLYDVGVAYEALAYQSEDHDAAKKFLQEAAINYGKAVDSKPDEKYFLPPQKRIETAMAYFRKIEAQREEVKEARKADPPPKSPGADPAPPAPAAGAKNTTTPAPKPVKNQPKPATPALNNDQIVEMFKAGVPEKTIVATIQDAASVDFDLTPKGLVQLANGGVKSDNILGAMRARTKRRSSTAGSS